jgi:hypothetical protein
MALTTLPCATALARDESGLHYNDQINSDDFNTALMTPQT